MNDWPLESECLTYYGDPNTPYFERLNLVRVPIPWIMYTSWNDDRMKTLLVHERCSVSLDRIIKRLWDMFECDQKKIDLVGLNRCGGAYCLRPMRGSKKLSMHAYGCAIDIDPANNGLCDATPKLGNHIEIVKVFEEEGWEWGGRWARKDGMHFQAAKTKRR